MNWHPRDIEELTLCEFLIISDSYNLAKWDHTAQLSCLIAANTTVLINANSKRAHVKPQSLHYYHPYRKQEKTKKEGYKVTHKNFRVLYHLGNALIGNR